MPAKKKTTEKKAKPAKKTARKYLYAVTFATGEDASVNGSPIVEHTAASATEVARTLFDDSELGKPVRYVLESSIRSGGR